MKGQSTGRGLESMEGEMNPTSRKEAKRIIQQWRSLAERNMREGRAELEASENAEDPDLRNLLMDSGLLAIQWAKTMLDWCDEQEPKLSNNK